MKSIDQCPSTRGTRDIPEAAPELGRTRGQQYWRSVEEYAGTPEFKEWVEREFPAGASQLLHDTRRTFMKLMGASLALAGAATLPACRRPEEKVLTYSREVPEQVIPGKPLYYATAMPLPGGGAEGLLVESHTGRPTNIAGNPLHPINQGKASDTSIASILNLYDPDRLKFPILDNTRLTGSDRGRLPATWDDFRAWSDPYFANLASDGGRGLAFLVTKKTSPTRDAVRDAITSRFPEARWIAYDPSESTTPYEGHAIAFGRPMAASLRLDRARVILSLDHDFMGEGADRLVNARNFAAARKAGIDGDAAELPRLYVVEPWPSSTGSMADHRIRMSPSRIADFTIALAREILSKSPASGSAALNDAVRAANIQVAESGPTEGPDRPDFTTALVVEVAKDLLSSRGRALVTAGSSQPAEVHALVAAINAALQSVGETVRYLPVTEELASNPAEQLATLADDLRSGAVTTLVCVDTNPAYDLPSLGFADLIDSAPDNGQTVITWGVGQTETGKMSLWELNGTTYLESWGDVRAFDGTVSAVQPLIAPLYAPAMSEIEFLAMLAGMTGEGDAALTGRDLVRRTWSQQLGVDPDSDNFDKFWRRALHDGFLNDSAEAPESPDANFAGISQALVNRTVASGLEVVFKRGRLGDGRYANNAWLQELPHEVTQVVWDNPLVMSPRMARDLGVIPAGDVELMYTKDQIPQARVARLSVNGEAMKVACWVCPGMADNTLGMYVGYGRGSVYRDGPGEDGESRLLDRTIRGVGRVGEDVGFNAYLVKPVGQLVASGASLERVSGSYGIASTQSHWSLEGRHAVLRSMDIKWFDQHTESKDKPKPDKIYGAEYSVDSLTVAEKIGELSHTPVNRSIYKHPYNNNPGYEPDNTTGAPDPGSVYAQSPQWGMTIDLSLCHGCGVCTVACQSENNIPVVGKTEVAKGRELQWIRVDRYFVGEDYDNPTALMMQPVACVHCENAPCETVCPVNATVHGEMGTNNMAYNRCIGTRYCANNCPYKVRRFNWFDYSQLKFRGGLDPDYVPPALRKEYLEGPGDDRKFNPNFIPPRLREKIDEISAMQFNPSVTVRSRGVMEKCSYCIQRINRARRETKINDIWTRPAAENGSEGRIPDGFFETACEQACPTNAITFGDIQDPTSRVSRERNSERSYLLLGYLNTRPRTSHMLRVDNPNMRVLELTLTPAEFEERLHDPLDHGAGDGHGYGEGDDAGNEHSMVEEEHASTFFDRTKKVLDDGYALSLSIV